MEHQFDMATIRARLTCSICKKYFIEATTIIECMHTFCRKCIYHKLGEEGDSETDSETFNCPVCDVDLGTDPLEKLRPDYSLQNLRNRVFPLRRAKAKKLRVGPSGEPPATGSAVSTQNKGKSLTIGEVCQSVPEGGTENAADQLEEQTDEWQPSSSLAEADDKKSKSPKSSNTGNKGKAKVDNEKAGKNPVSSSGAKRKKVRRERRKKERANDESGKAASACSTSAKVIRINGPIWFCLMASEEQDGDAPLHQIQSKYLRIVDGNMPVFMIQKYLSKKLDLKSEDEVEIRCLREPVIPELEMRELVGMWLHAMPSSRRITTTVGSSGKDFMMVLEYARKVPTPKPQTAAAIA